jgi:hypothetical protein
MAQCLQDKVIEDGVADASLISNGPIKGWFQALTTLQHYVLEIRPH